MLKAAVATWGWVHVMGVVPTEMSGSLGLTPSGLDCVGASGASFL